MLGPKKDKRKVCSLLDSTSKILGPGSWPTVEDSQFCQALGYQNRSKGLVWHYIDIDAMLKPIVKEYIFRGGRTSEISFSCNFLQIFRNTIPSCQMLLKYRNNGSVWNMNRSSIYINRSKNIQAEACNDARMVRKKDHVWASLGAD